MTTPNAYHERVGREALEGRIEGFLFRRLNRRQEAFPLRHFVPELTWNRFDLAFKLLYLDALAQGETAFANSVYEAHISALSLGDISEPGNPEKAGIVAFKESFRSLFEDLRQNGFDASRTIVPLARDGSLLNGAHRSAAASVLGLEVVGVETGLEPMVFDYVFFRRRGVVVRDMDAAASRFIAALPTVAVALLWPAAHGRDSDVEALLGPMIYTKRISLRQTGAHNLLARVYQGEPWVGPARQHYPGIKEKLVRCFSGSDDLRLLVFNAPDQTQRVVLKEKVREIFGIGKSSIHITDSHDEAVELSKLLLNENSIHFLNHAFPTKFSETLEKVEIASRFLDDHHISRSDVALDTGMVLGAYGLRAPGDIDVLTEKALPDGQFEVHDGRYRQVPLREIVADPSHHFYYFDMKFVSLKQVADLKRVRLAGRDREDLLQIEALPTSEQVASRWEVLAFRLDMTRLRVRRAGIRILFRLGLGDAAKRVYRRLSR